MTSISQEFKILREKIWNFSYYWLPLNSCHIIQQLYTLPKKFSNPIGLEKTFNGSQIKFSEKS